MCELKKLLPLLIFVLSASMLHSQSLSMIWADAVYDSAGSFVSIAEEIKLDASGNSYTVGTFSGTMDFDPGSGYSYMSTGSGTCVFILKLNASGNFVWARKFASSGHSLSYSLDLDAAENIIIAGDFTYTVDLDPGSGTANHVAGGTGFWEDAFIVKLDPSGNYLWSKSFGGIDQDEALAVAFDGSGNIYTTGIFRQTVDFDPGAGTFSASVTSGGLGIYVSKLDPSGNFIWAKTIVGSTGPDGGQGKSITIGDDNSVYYSGHFTGTLDFDPGAGTSNMTAPTGASCHVYVSKLDSLGNFVWAKKMGGTGLTIATSLALDKKNNVYSTGWFSATADFDPGAGVFNLVSAPNDDVFISKLGPLGDFVWAKKIGGSQQDYGACITTDSLQNVYTTGFFSGTVDFNPGTAGFFMTSGSAGGDLDAFISKLDSTGNFQMAVHIGSNGSSQSNAILVDDYDNIFITGQYAGTVDFEPGSGVFNLPAVNTSSVFVEKLHQSLVGINEIATSSQVSVFPNPTNSYFSLLVSEDIKDGSVQIYNSLGELIFSKSISTNELQLDLKDQCSGFYFVKVISDGKIIGTQKIVKQ